MENYILSKKITRSWLKILWHFTNRLFDSIQSANGCLNFSIWSSCSLNTPWISDTVVSFRWSEIGAEIVKKVTVLLPHASSDLRTIKYSHGSDEIYFKINWIFLTSLNIFIYKLTYKLYNQNNTGQNIVDIPRVVKALKRIW